MFFEIEIWRNLLIRISAEGVESKKMSLFPHCRLTQANDYSSFPIYISPFLGCFNSNSTLLKAKEDYKLIKAFRIPAVPPSLILSRAGCYRMCNRSTLHCSVYPSTIRRWEWSLSPSWLSWSIDLPIQQSCVEARYPIRFAPSLVDHINLTSLYYNTDLQSTFLEILCYSIYPFYSLKFALLSLSPVKL